MPSLRIELHMEVSLRIEKKRVMERKRKKKQRRISLFSFSIEQLACLLCVTIRSFSNSRYLDEVNFRVFCNSRCSEWLVFKLVWKTRFGLVESNFILLPSIAKRLQAHFANRSWEHQQSALFSTEQPWDFIHPECAKLQYSSYCSQSETFLRTVHSSRPFYVRDLWSIVQIRTDWIWMLML